MREIVLDTETTGLDPKKARIVQIGAVRIDNGRVRPADAFEKLVWFSRGYFRAEEAGGKVVVSDLRMGLTPGYAFRFAIGERTLDGIASIPPERDMSYRRSSDGDGAWLMKRLAGEPAPRAAEQTMEAATDALVKAC